LFRRKRRGKELDVVSTAIHGGAAAVNAWVHQQPKVAERGTSGAAFGCLV